MFLKNNSNRQWLQYDCGAMKIDILPGAVFEVNDAIGETILRNLGAPNWITKTEAPKKVEKIEKKEVEKEEVKKVLRRK